MAKNETATANEPNIAEMQKQIEALSGLVATLTGKVPENNADRTMHLRWSEVAPFIDDKKPRPDNELYCVMKLKPGDKFSKVRRTIEILPDRRGKNTADEYIPDQPAIRVEFSEPVHMIGSDLDGYIVMMADLLASPEISVTAKTMELAKAGKLRLPETYIGSHGDMIPLSERPGALPFEDALVRVKDRPAFIPRPDRTELDNPSGNYWDGETFRRWCKLMYGLRKGEMDLREKTARDLAEASDYERMAGLAG